MANVLLLATAVAALISLSWLLLLQIRTSRLLATYRQLIGGVKPGNLEQMMSMHVGRINDHDRRLLDLNVGLADLDKVLQTAIQHVGLVRFNPFEETGGDQSFAIALLDRHGNGLVLSSLHSRSETRVYAKPIENGRSRYQLSDEEQQAVAEATTTGIRQPVS